MIFNRCLQLVVRGRVQGVYYRAWTKQQADEIGLDGWVRNRRDGSVEAVLDGTPEDVDEMLGRMKAGPPDASVDTIEIISEGGAAPKGFEVRDTA
ncbi:acylphosphatase [Tepidamorphus sp. 3E244]|uniref:acylphosphatase n=1 Tax=Tepidamorphus sp. 3E244 TaxID=3385498 RepID=UPI0038FC3C95